MKKMLFFDIDGTILTGNSPRYVPESAKKAIRLLQANGHLCFINTGRSWSEIHHSISDLDFDGYVCGCGTYISYQDEVLLAQEIESDLADSVLNDMNLCHLEWILEGASMTYYSTEPYTTYIGEFQKEYHQHLSDTCMDVPPATRGLRFDKFCICLRSDSDFQTFEAKYRNHFTFIDRGHQFFEVVPVRFSKGSGIQFLMDYFKIPLADTFAIGDSTNDMPMLTFAGTSIAMKESDDIVLQTADFITDTVENDGIYKAMKHFHLI